MSCGKILVRYRDRRTGHSYVSDQWETVEPKRDKTTKARPKGTFMFEGEMSIFKCLFSNALRKHYYITDHFKKRMYFLWQCG
jgi:hypothetical protein